MANKVALKWGFWLSSASKRKDSMKFQLGAVWCCTPEKCPQPQPQPRPQPPPCTLQSYHEKRRGNRRSQQQHRGRMMDRSKSSLQSEWEPSLSTISEDATNMSLEALGRMEGQLEAQVTPTKASTSSAHIASVSTNARGIKQASTVHMAIPSFIPPSFFF